MTDQSDKQNKFMKDIYTTTSNNNLPVPDHITSEDEKKETIFLKKLLPIILSAIFIVAVFITIAYLAFVLKASPSLVNRNASVVPAVLQKTPPVVTSKKRLEDIVSRDEKISKTKNAPNNNFVFLVTQKPVPVENKLKENVEGPIIFIMDNLLFVNLVTGEKKEFDLYKLASEEIINPLKTIPVETQFRLYPNLLKWSSDSQNFWGAISLVSSADPPVNDSVSIFKINMINFNVEKFAIPGRFINTLKPHNLNLEREAVLFETVTLANELLLYNYKIPTREKTVVVSYPTSIFSKYFPGKDGFVGYFYPHFLGETVESRPLEAKWINKDALSYIDFVTRKEVVKKVEN